MQRKIITLTTDFGLKDSYVAEMKAVILSICPETCIVDISHEVRKFNIIIIGRLPAPTPGSIRAMCIDPLGKNFAARNNRKAPNNN